MYDENKNGVEENEVEENEGIEDQANQSNIGNNNASGSEREKKERTFTQDQVSRMMTKEKRQGAASVYRELGIDPKDTKAVAMVKALIASQKTDDQKTAEKQREEEAKEREANERVEKAEIKAEAMVLGIKREYVDDMVALVMSKKTEDSDIKTLLGEYKKKYSVWFDDGGSDDDKGNDKKTGQKGTGSSINSNKSQKGNTKEQGLGQRLAARRAPEATKKSFWS